jgi:hypothetical protein
MPVQVLDNTERGLDPRANLRFGLLGHDHQIFQRGIRRRRDLEPRTTLPSCLSSLIVLADAGIACVTEHLLLIAMQQRVDLLYIRHVWRLW